jgi:hypothetical protein
MQQELWMLLLHPQELGTQLLLLRMRGRLLPGAAQGNAAPANASSAALSDGGASSDQAEDADHGGDRHVYFQYFDPQLHWTQTGHNHQ